MGEVLRFLRIAEIRVTDVGVVDIMVPEDRVGVIGSNITGFRVPEGRLGVWCC